MALLRKKRFCLHTQLHPVPQALSSLLADPGDSTRAGVGARGWGLREGLLQRDQGPKRAQAMLVTRAQRLGAPGWALHGTVMVGMAFVAAASRGLIALLERQQPLFSLHAASLSEKHFVPCFAF